tara:strand:+ start:1479 stop:1835 length:357 start_codon:yes stop_codon:yes gene_type:complete
MSESLEQSLTFSWAEKNEHLRPELKFFFAVPNGGYRPKATGRRLKLEGLKKGIPDTFLAYPTGGYSGLFLEFKYGKNRLTPEQIEWFRKLRSVKYRCEVVRSFEEARKLILEYLGYEQ